MIACITLTIFWSFIVYMAVLNDCKGLFIGYGIFSLLMYVNVATTTICNALTTRVVDKKGDIFWKLYFIIMTSLSFGAYFCI